MAVNSRVPTAVLAACLIAVAVVVIMSTDAHASQGVACGGTITTDTTLSKNLNCPGDGLTISTDGVTLDLNGHKMSGSGTGVGIMVSGKRPDGRERVRGWDSSKAFGSRTPATTRR